MSNAEQLEIQNQKFLQLFDVAISKSTFYQKLYAEYGVGKHDIKSVEDISKLPVITKSKIRDCIDDIYIGNPLLKAKGYTSGTSGSPLVIYRSYQSIVEEQASIWAWRSGFGYLPGLKTVSLRGDLGRDEMMRHDKVANVLYLSSYNIKKENANWYYNQIKDFSPYAIIAYPSSVDNLANILLSIDKRLNVPYVFTASEMLYDNQRSKISNAFQTQVFDRYGNAERTIAIEQRSDGSYYESPCYSVNEYQEDCTITTSLIDNSFPLIRYKVTDIIQPSKYTSTEDANRFKIDKIIGRDDDVLLMPDGTKVGRLDVVLKGINHLEYAQFIQEQPDSFILNLVVTPDFSAEDEKKIVANLQYRLGGNMRYELRKVKEEDIIISKSGKFKLVINRIKELDLTL
uniref:Phenylacetate--CoA ligase family protein n=1 Tax=Roseihalotalea indica TaxID=2867963 RepID=A0AA49JF68_9BACT|nr:hypothetical protein K4G66_20155 [Tunicatimonas sp. TK19036]